MVAGALIGYAAAKKSGGIENELNEAGGIVVGGFLGAGVGTVAGLVICGSSDKKYLINGDWKSFEEMKRSMNYSKNAFMDEQSSTEPVSTGSSFYDAQFFFHFFRYIQRGFRIHNSVPFTFIQYNLIRQSGGR